MFRVAIGSMMAIALLAASVSAGAPLIPAADELRHCVRASACADRVVVGRVTEVRIAGPVSDAPPVLGPTPHRRPTRSRRKPRGLYFLALHHTGEFYTIAHFVPKYIKETFDRDTKRARRYLGLLADPIASLRSKEPEDRLATAVLILTRHRAYRSTKTVPIPAGENGLILGALAEIDWGHEPDAPLHPYRVVHELWRLSQVGASKAGEVFKEPVLPGKTPAEQSEFLREWVRKNRDTYRIERTTFE